MASVIRCISLLMFCAVVVADEPIQSDETRILDFISVLSGNWSNKHQVESGTGDHDLIEGYARQVKIPALANQYLVLVENAINNQVTLLNVMEVTVDKTDKNLIRLTPYQFTDNRTYKPREFNIDDLQNLTSSQLKLDPDCVDNLVRMSEGLYSGICAMCGTNMRGKNPGYAVTITCDECTGAYPLSVPAKSTTIPYVFRLIGEKFQPLNAPANYVNPCNKKLASSFNSTQG